MSKVEKFSLYL